MKLLDCILIMALLLACAAGCKKKPEENRVDLDQIQVDDSNDYRYIFREAIREEEERRVREKKRDFR